MKLLNDIGPGFIIPGSLQNMQQHPELKAWGIGNEYGIVGKSGDAFLQDNSRRLVPVASECPFATYNCIRIYYPEYSGVGFRQCLDLLKLFLQCLLLRKFRSD